MKLKINAKFEGKLTCAFQNAILQVYFCRLKNSDLILESEIEELNVNKNKGINLYIIQRTLRAIH